MPGLETDPGAPYRFAMEIGDPAGQLPPANVDPEAAELCEMRSRLYRLERPS